MKVIKLLSKTLHAYGMKPLQTLLQEATEDIVKRLVPEKRAPQILSIRITNC